MAFHSYTEPHLATDNELARTIIVATVSSLAKVEAQKISERSKAGLARARARGKKIGMPKVPEGVEAAVRASLAQGTGILKTAKVLGVGVGTVQRIKADLTTNASMGEECLGSSSYRPTYPRVVDRRAIRKSPGAL